MFCPQKRNMLTWLQRHIYTLILGFDTEFHAFICPLIQFDYFLLLSYLSLITLSIRDYLNLYDK